jgi:hypothetical protein
VGKVGTHSPWVRHLRMIPSGATKGGPPQAITATARKLAVLVYRVLNGSRTGIPAPTPTMANSGRVCYADCGSAPPRSVSNSSIARPARSSSPRPLRLGRKFLGRALGLDLRKRWRSGDDPPGPEREQSVLSSARSTQAPPFGTMPSRQQHIPMRRRLCFSETRSLVNYSG